MNLQQQNQDLKKKLQVAESWMKREIQNQILAVSKKHILEKTGAKNTEFLTTQMDDIIVEKILGFFSDISLSSMPDKFIEHLTSSEVQYYLLQKGTPVDPLSITIGYQKIFEILVDTCVTSLFLQYAKKHKTPDISSPDALETSIMMVVKKGYSLSIGRLYHILSEIRDKLPLSGYKQLFSDFLNSDTNLKNTLLSQEFLVQLCTVVESEVFSSKRHTGSISEDDVSLIRKTCIGELEDKNCLMYSLFSTQNII